jgi:hypothetical protein
MKKIDRLLDAGITQAFNQIFEKRYALEYLGKGNKVYGVAVSVVSRTYVRIEMQEVKVVQGLDTATVQRLNI